MGPAIGVRARVAVAWARVAALAGAATTRVAAPAGIVAAALVVAFVREQGRGRDDAQVLPIASLVATTPVAMAVIGS